MDDEPVDMNKIKKCLEDANVNVLDENLSDDKLIEFYKAIKNSESSHDAETSTNLAQKSLNESADELIEAIQNSESIAPSMSKKRRCTDDNCDNSINNDFSELVQVESQNEQIAINNNHLKEVSVKEPILDATKAKFGFNDMPRSQECPLKVQHYPLQFVNIGNSTKYLNADSEARINMWYEYHVAVNKHQYQMSRLSHNMAPKCKPIMASEEPLAVNPTISSLKDEEFSTDNTYISRSGRHTKRKVYNEPDDLEIPPQMSMKWSKTDEEFTIKSKQRKSESNNNNVSSPSSTLYNLSDVEEDMDDFDKLKSSSTGSKTLATYQKKMPSNDEIISRSSLFKDVESSAKRGRTETILNAAKYQIEKQKKQEEAWEEFTKELDVDSDDSENVEVVEVERRVIAPRRPIRGRKKANPLNITTKKVIEGLNGATELNGGSNERPLIKAARRRLGNSNNSNNANSNSTTKKELNMTMCPLCSNSFPQKEIENHASTCGEDAFPQPATLSQRITCEVCEEVVPFDTEYEIHVRACIQKDRRDKMT